MTGDTDPGWALVTGAAGDIGEAICRRLAAEGFQITMVDIADPDEAAQPIRDVRRLATAPVEYLQADVTSAEAMSKAFEGRSITFTVANAGIGRSCAILDLTPSEWEAHLQTNLSGAFYTSQAAARSMVARGEGGRIVLTSSWIGSVPWPEMTAYAVSKAGIEMLTKQLARELAEHQILVNCVAPGIVRAGMAKVQLETEPQYAARVAKVVPLKQLQTADEVAGIVRFLASKDAGYLTGSKITADGGCSLFAFD